MNNMSYYSEIQYKKKENLWFENLYFERWFKNNLGPILDIGCATGNFIATHPDIVEGIEIDDDSLRICHERGLRVKKIDADKDMSLILSDSYSGIYAKQVIEHLKDPLDFLRQIRRVLCQGGKAVILTPNCPYVLNKTFWQDPTHKNPLSQVDLRRLAERAGFNKIKIYDDFRCFSGLGRIMRMFNLSPAFIAKIQRLLFIRGLSLILEVEK